MSLSPETAQKINIFLHDVLAVDTETTGFEEGCEIVELGSASLLDGYESKFDLKSSLFKPSEPIPPEASMVNHISNRMVKDRPCFSDDTPTALNIIDTPKTYFVTHNAQFDIRVLKDNLGKSGVSTHAVYDRNNWICTMRLAKHLFAGADKDISYSLQYLRYFLDVEVHGEAHRTDGDNMVVIAVLKEIATLLLLAGKIKGENIGAELHELCWSAIPITTWPIRGKHKGDLLTDIPSDYYDWALNKMDRFDENNVNYDEDLAVAVTQVLSERLDVA